jgi:hypothetical protein
MTELAIDSAEATAAVATSIKWLNMQVNQVKPFTLEGIEKVTQEADGTITSFVDLVTEAAPTRKFKSELGLNPAIDNPTAVFKHKQLF